MPDVSPPALSGQEISNTVSSMFDSNTANNGISKIEPRLAIEQIQGNIIPGFSKDFAMLLFLKIDLVVACKYWLEMLLPDIATAAEVLAFNRLFKQIRLRRSRDAQPIKATWVNIAFSYAALVKLTKGLSHGDLAIQDFTDTSFKNGLAQQSALLHDPTTDSDEGSSQNWVVGGPQNEADILLIVQSDSQNDLLAEVKYLEESIFALLKDGKHVTSGVHLLYKEQGGALAGSLAGHEHFGFLDGISQPGLRGSVSDNPVDLLTPRQNPGNPNQGKPGQDLLWPGAFVFGYPGQERELPVETAGSIVKAGPEWADNGSFLVFRRLRQDVGVFHQFLQDEGTRLHLEPALLGAKVVGRWQSGAPLLGSQLADNAALGNDDSANNDFAYANCGPVHNQPQNLLFGPGTSHPIPSTVALSGDPSGQVCPVFSHIRKSYPRDDITPGGLLLAAAQDSDVRKCELSRQDTQTHRLLRRGISYGPAAQSTIEAPCSDNIDRGLLFMAYQTSIQNQFEFITQNWINNGDFKDPAAGIDLLVAQNIDTSQLRTAQLILNDKSEILTAQRWVTPTGGGYFFAPSIDALEKYLTK